MNNLDEKAKKLLEDYKNIQRDDINGVYKKANLSDKQIETLKEYSEILDDKLVMYAPKWLIQNQNTNIIKFIAIVLSKIEKQCNKEYIKSYINILFSNAMDYDTTIIDSGVRLAPKKDQFFDILFEWEIMEYFIDRGYSVDINVEKLESGKKAEFSILKNMNEYYVEAKNLNRNEILDIIYRKHEDNFNCIGAFHLDETQEREIRERFKNQVKSAKRKFRNNEVNHMIFIQVPTELNVLGKKLKEYINKWVNSKHNPGLNYIGIFTDKKRYIYDVKSKKFNKENRK